MTELMRTFPATEAVAWMILGLVLIGSSLSAVLSWLLARWQKTKRQTWRAQSGNDIKILFTSGART
jgi:hypothetical protein